MAESSRLLSGWRVKLSRRFESSRLRKRASERLGDVVDPSSCCLASLERVVHETSTTGDFGDPARPTRDRALGSTTSSRDVPGRPLGSHGEAADARSDPPASAAKEGWLRGLHHVEPLARQSSVRLRRSDPDLSILCGCRSFCRPRLLGSCSATPRTMSPAMALRLRPMWLGLAACSSCSWSRPSWYSVRRSSEVTRSVTSATGSAGDPIFDEWALGLTPRELAHGVRR